MAMALEVMEKVEVVLMAQEGLATAAAAAMVLAAVEMVTAAKRKGAGANRQEGRVRGQKKQQSWRRCWVAAVTALAAAAEGCVRLRECRSAHRWRWWWRKGWWRTRGGRRWWRWLRWR